jgi:hypothetical protein
MCFLSSASKWHADFRLSTVTGWAAKSCSVRHVPSNWIFLRIG